VRWETHDDELGGETEKGVSSRGHEELLPLLPPQSLEYLFHASDA
jgi:hypothetical protein